MSDAPWLVIGLGNPGAEYEATRHNIGAMCCDLLAERVRSKFSRHKRGNADVVEKAETGRQDPADFVLRAFGSTERKELPTFLERAADAIEMLVNEGLEKTQNNYQD